MESKTLIVGMVLCTMAVFEMIIYMWPDSAFEVDYPFRTVSYLSLGVGLLLAGALFLKGEWQKRVRVIGGVCLCMSLIEIEVYSLSGTTIDESIYPIRIMVLMVIGVILSRVAKFQWDRSNWADH
jgi:hypothetical protein